MFNKEDLRKIMRETFSLTGHVNEADVELRSDELAGTLIMAGPEKVGDVIRNMSSEEFAQFATEIKKAGIAMVSRKMVDVAGVTDSSEDDGVTLDTEEPGDSVESPSPTEGDIGDSEILKDL